MQLDRRRPQLERRRRTRSPRSSRSTASRRSASTTARPTGRTRAVEERFPAGRADPHRRESRLRRRQQRRSAPCVRARRRLGAAAEQRRDRRAGARGRARARGGGSARRRPARVQDPVRGRPDGAVRGRDVQRAARLLRAADRLRHAGPADDDGVRDVGRADGAALALSRAAFERVGRPRRVALHVRRGRRAVAARAASRASRVVLVPAARVRHKGSAASGGRASTTNLFYSVRNTIAVSERYAPLPFGAARASPLGRRRRASRAGAVASRATRRRACRGRRLAGGARRAQRAALTPTYDRVDAEARVHHRDRRPGRLAARRAPARRGLRGGRRRPESASSYPNLAAIADRIELVEADLNDRVSLARALQSCAPDEVYNLASVSFVPMSWEEPVLTAELAAVGVTSLLEAIREVGAPIRFYQASSSRDLRRAGRIAAARVDAGQPADAVRRREDVRPLHHAQLPAPLRDARLVRDPLQPHLAAAAGRVRAAQDHRRGRGDQARAAGRCGSETSSRAATGAMPTTTSAASG